MDGSNLTSNGQKELCSYLNFFNLKKQEAMREVDLDFEEFTKHQVQEVLYNKDDVCDLIVQLNKTIKVSIEKEVSKIIHMSGVYVKIFLSFAADLDFHADFSFIENMQFTPFLYRQILEQIKILEKGGSIIDNQERKIKYSRLPTIDVGQQKLLEEAQKELEFLKGYNIKLQNELILLKKDEGSQQQILQEENKQLKHEISQLTEEINKKLNESAQFKNLKQMIQEKNQLINELKAKIGS
ncbi:Leucine zipper transcription factor-like protein 1 [Paramecium bursaria]